MKNNIITIKLLVFYLFFSTTSFYDIVAIEAYTQQQFACPICLETLTLPCGHIFCASCIERHYQTSSTIKCPLCRAENTEIITDLKQMVRANKFKAVRKLLTKYKFLVNHIIDPEKQETLAHHAVKFGARKTLLVLIEFNVDLNKKNIDGQTPLDYAVLYDDTKSIIILCEYAHLTYTGNSSLHHAIKRSSREVIDTLLRHYPYRSIFVNDPDTAGNTPLHNAVTVGPTLSIQSLINYGANVNSQALVTKHTPLHYAAMQENKYIALRIAKILLKNNADTQARDAKDKTPEYYAVLNGNPELVELLREYTF